MSLNNLPSELMASIMNFTLHLIGLHKAAQLRIVCRRFNVFILDAIYALPTFEKEDESSIPEILRRDYAMPRSLIAGLIHAKMREGESKKGPLCLAIDRTADFLLDKLDQGASRADCVNVLATAAANAMYLRDIVRCLSPGAVVNERPNRQLEDAVVAAILLDDLRLVKSLLDCGASASAKTRFFGELLSVATSKGLGIATAHLLSRMKNEQISPYFFQLRRMNAFEAAAENGHMFLVDAMLVTGGLAREASYLYDRAVASSGRAGHEDIAIYLMHHRQPLQDLEKERMFWDNLFRIAARWNRIKILTALLGSGICFSVKTIELSLEDACRIGHLEATQLILWHNMERTDFFGSASFYWAGLFGDRYLMEVLCYYLGAHAGALVNAIAGAMYVGNADMVNYILARGGCPEWPIAEPMRRRDVIDFLIQRGSMDREKIPPTDSMPAAIEPSSSFRIDPVLKVPPPPPAKQPYPYCYDGEPQEILLLETYSGISDIGRIHETLQHLQRESHMVVSKALMTAAFGAARHRHPGVFSYLSENSDRENDHPFPEWVIKKCQSSAIFQVYREYGWWVDHHCRCCRPTDSSALGRLTFDEFLVRWFLEIGADPNATWYGGSPLSAIRHDYSSASTIKLLLEYGASIEKGFPLQNAAYRQNEDCLEFLELFLHLGAPINEIIFEHDAEILEWSDHKFDAGAALHIAAERGMVDIAQFLLDNGADHTIRDGLGRTALHSAARKGMVNVVQLLLDIGADHTLRDELGRTAFHSAAMNGMVNAAQVLLDNGADATLTDLLGMTALHLAADEGSVEGTRFLLDNGADHTLTDSQGQTALGYAQTVRAFVRGRGHAEVAALLRNAEA